MSVSQLNGAAILINTNNRHYSADINTFARKDTNIHQLKALRIS